MKTLSAVFAIVLGVAAVSAQSPSKPAAIERLDARLDEIFAADVRLEVLKEDYFGANEGPAWVRDPKGQFLVFSDMAANRIYKWDPAAKQFSVHVENAGFSKLDLSQTRVFSNGRLLITNLGSNGIAVDRDGRLIVCTHGDRSVVRLEKDGTRTTLVDSYEGKRLNRPNDLAIRPDGSFYFTDGGTPRGGTFRWKPDGTVQLVSRLPSNGIAFSPDGRYAYTTDPAGSKDVTRHEVRPDGTFANPTPKFIDRDADGIKVDDYGNIYGSDGWIAASDGKVLGAVRIPLFKDERLTNLTFGDPDGRGIYYVSFRGVFHIRTKRSAWK